MSGYAKSLHDEFQRAERMLARAVAAESKIQAVEALLNVDPQDPWIHRDDIRTAITDDAE